MYNYMYQTGILHVLKYRYTCVADTCVADTCVADTCVADTCVADTCIHIYFFYYFSLEEITYILFRKIILQVYCVIVLHHTHIFRIITMIYS